MPRTSPESGRHPVPEGGARVVAFGAYDAAPDLTVLEFCVGMALARKGPLTASGIAAEISAWFDHPVRARSLGAQLDAMVRRGWARLEAGNLHDRRSRKRRRCRGFLLRACAPARWRPPAARRRRLHVPDQGIREERIMIHRQSITVLVAASLNLAGNRSAARLRQRRRRGAPERGRALLQGAQARHLVLLREAQRGAAQELPPRRHRRASAWPRSAPSLTN
jgi:hypothetical protein